MSFVGCHGVAVSPSAAGAAYGRAAVSPRGSLVIEDSALRAVPEGAGELWRASAVVGERDAEHVMWQAADGTMVLAVGGTVVLGYRSGSAWVGEVDAAVALQVISTFALPLEAQRWGALIVHAAVACRPGRPAVMVCAASGSGKSSTLIALVDAGWMPVSEDLVAVSFEPTGPVVWPGPPWVRVAPGQPGPAASAVAFEVSDKVGWTLAPIDRPVEVGHVVLLAPPHDAPTVVATVPRPALIGALAGQTPWFGDPADRASALWGPIVRLAGSVPATSVTMRRSPVWQAEIVGILESL